MAKRDYPVGSAQQKVLDALGLTATGFGDAERQFEELNIVVVPKREGRTSVPAVYPREGRSQRNYGGDYDVDQPEVSQTVAEKLSKWWNG